MINEHDIKDHQCHLYDVIKGSRFKLAEEDVRVPPASIPFKLHDIFTLGNLDGMYSRCFDSEGKVHHFAAYTKVRVLHE